MVIVDHKRLPSSLTLARQIKVSSTQMSILDQRDHNRMLGKMSQLPRWLFALMGA
jgi:hypothetical protein